MRKIFNINKQKVQIASKNKFKTLLIEKQNQTVRVRKQHVIAVGLRMKKLTNIFLSIIVVTK